MSILRNIIHCNTKLLHKYVSGFSKSCNITKVFAQVVSCQMSTNVSISQKEKESMEEMLPVIIDPVITSANFIEVPEISKWINEILHYTLVGGKYVRGLATVMAYKMLEKPDKINEESVRLARIMGWCVEISQTYLLLVDDIIDNAKSRRNKPCWHRKPEVGIRAVNDTSFVYSSIFQVLRKYFSDHPRYIDIVNFFNETILLVSMGQHLDTFVEREKNKDYYLFTKERYNTLIKYKTGSYTYRLPVCLALYLVNITDQELHHKVEDVCVNLGAMYQMQDDFHDCYLDDKTSNETYNQIGIDIQSGKCTWLAVTALQRCTRAQRVMFTTCYGSPELAHVDRIKRLYDELQLQQVFADEERAVYETIRNKIRALPDVLSPALFQKLLDTIYKRTY